MSPNIERVKGISETSQNFLEFELQEISIRLVFLLSRLGKTSNFGKFQEFKSLKYLQIEKKRTYGKI